jgi:CubicO group peptidase (beta-lactamase class C family)
MTTAVAAVALGLFSAATAMAQTPPALPDPAGTDPAKLGIMQGSPPPTDKIARFGNGSHYKFPLTRWSFSHWRELVPTANVRHGDGAPTRLARAGRDLDKLPVALADGTTITFAEALAKTYTDSVLVLHDGKVVYEKYWGATAPHRPHILMSVTKSFTGLLGAMLAAEGKIDPAAPVVKYVPELKDSAYGDATVRQVMDMTVGVKYSEAYNDPNAEIWAYARAAELLPRAPDYKGPGTIYEFLTTLQKEGEHGKAFAYKTVNSEVLGWIIKRASGQSVSDLLSERIWRKLGAQDDAYYAVDGIGVEAAGGGLNTTLRDLARFGEMMRNKGKYNGRQIVPAAVVAEIQRGASRDDFAKAGYTTLPGWSYKDMWWISHNDHGMYLARGIHGQNIYVDPKAKLVIARFASHPIAANTVQDPIILPAFAAVANAVMKK